MSQLAIKGHPKRGKEVIQLLEMLGGKNLHGYTAECESMYFYICDGLNNIYYDWADNPRERSKCLFTLEEFEEKFPYKVVDKVKNARINDFVGRIINVRWDDSEEQVIYYVEWDDETKSTLSHFANGLQPYKEEKGDKAKAPNLIGEDYSEGRFGYKIPQGYEFDCIKNNEIIIKPIKPQYPKTYVECAKILNCFSASYIDGYKNEVIEKLQELLICRDAYWKIAGKELGLGKPWEQDYDDRCFIIANNKGNIHTYEYHGNDNVILAFPTEEMRDAFYENFNDLINECKELL